MKITLRLIESTPPAASVTTTDVKYFLLSFENKDVDVLHRGFALLRRPVQGHEDAGAPERVLLAHLKDYQQAWDADSPVACGYYTQEDKSEFLEVADSATLRGLFKAREVTSELAGALVNHLGTSAEIATWHATPLALFEQDIHEQLRWRCSSMLLFEYGMLPSLAIVAKESDEDSDEEDLADSDE